MFKSIIYQSCRDGATAYWVLPVLLGSKASYSRTQNGGGRFTLGIVIFIYQVQKLRKEAKIYRNYHMLQNHLQKVYF